MNAAEILDKALFEKKTITFEYDGHSRTMEPHHYGMLGESRQLHGYQISGDSSSGPLPNWRNFKLEKMNALVVNDSNFTTEPSYNPSNTYYTSIENQIER